MKNNLHFRQSHIVSIKLILFLVISIFFLLIDKNLELSNKIRNNTSYLIKPIYSTAEAPLKIFNKLSIYIDSMQDLIKKNKILEKKVFIQSGIIQKIPLLKEENKRLKKLLNSSESMEDSKIIVAELIKVNLNPFSNKIVIDKGEKNNLSLGQTVIDSLGLIGQVSEVNKDFSIVTLITDPGHALLAVNTRTEKRVMVSGTGDNRYLKAEYMSLNEDVIEGDILITSGLDNIFPEGYLIGVISKINKKDAFGLTTPLLTTSTGKKMGKTEQGAVWIDQNKYSSYDFYQYWRNVDDNDVEKLLLIFSDLNIEEIKMLIKQDINNAKKKLAYLVTTDCHSENSANQAEEKAKSIFENNSFDRIDEISFKVDLKLIDTLTSNNIIESKSEAKRLIEGGGIKIEDNPIKDTNLIIDKSYDKKILRIGKKKYFKIIIS